MKFSLECYPCLLKMALNTARVAGLDTLHTKNLLDMVMSFLIEKEPDITPPHIVSHMYTYIQNELHTGTDIFDPYKEIKAHTNSISLRYETMLFDLVAASSDKLRTAMSFAACSVVRM
ncbi:MAG: hypothetical protein GF350_07700 [Chitinivibrionales bacterium]|nr:hypothetical protein [Chitinivibrionales bacterium]